MFRTRPRSITQPLPQPGPLRIPARPTGPLEPILFPKLRDPVCRLPLPTLFFRLEASVTSGRLTLSGSLFHRWAAATEKAGPPTWQLEWWQQKSIWFNRKECSSTRQVSDLSMSPCRAHTPDQPACIVFTVELAANEDRWGRSDRSNEWRLWSWRVK